MSRSARYIPRARVPDIHWLGFRTSLNVFEKGEISCPCRELNKKNGRAGISGSRRGYSYEDVIKTNEINSHVPFSTHVSQCPRRVVLNTLTKTKQHNLNTKLHINVCNRIVM